MDKVMRSADQDRLPELRKSSSRESKGAREIVGLSRTGSGGFPKLGKEFNNYMLDDREVATEKHQNMTKEISKGISYLDVVSRVRDLERKYIDLASSLDRRVQAFIEESPQKVLRHLKGFEEKETTFWKENNYKQVALQDGLDNLKGSLRDGNDAVNHLLGSLQRRMDESEFKVTALLKHVEGLNHNSRDRLLALTDRPVEQEQKMGSLETEIKLLKEALSQERQRRDTLFQDMLQQYQEINNFVHKNENNMLHKMRKHKEDVIEENKRTKEQQKKLEEIKLEKLLGDSDYLKSLIRKVEGKVEEEVNKRLKHEFENKNWMEQKIALFKQEIKSDEKELLENEKRFLQNIQESMNSLSQTVTNTREQLEANLASTQTLFNENVKSLSKTVELVKNNVYSKLNILDTSVKDVDQRVSETQKNLHEHTVIISQTLDREFSRIEKVTLKFEEVMNQTLKSQDDKLVMYEENNKLWRKGFEDKNLKILTEISNALKTLKGDMNKDKIVTAERFENMKKEVDSNQAAAEKLIEQMNERIKGIEGQYEYKLDETVVKMTEHMKSAISSLSQDSTKVGASALDKATKDTLANVIALDLKLKTYTDSEIRKAKDELMQNTRNAADQVKNQISDDLRPIHVKLSELERQKANEMREVQSEFKLLHERVGDNFDENKEKLRQLSDEVDAKIKLAYQNARNQASEKVKDLRDEMTKSFATQNTYIKNEIEFTKSENERLADKVIEKARREMGAEKIDILNKCEELMEEERKLRSAKDTEIVSAIQNVKNMLMESINTKVESAQALVRALVNEETAERAKAVEGLTTTFKKRLDALEKFFKDLISVSIEETKLELKELIRNLEIKTEEQKVWTIQQLNIIVNDIEEYIITQTAKQYRDELFYQVEEKERTEQWKQIQEAFLIAGSKFEDIDHHRREDFEHIYMRMQEITNYIGNQDLAIKDIEKNVEDIEKNVEDNAKNIEDTQKFVEDVQKGVEENQKNIEEVHKNVGEVEKNVEEIQENLYLLDEKFSNGLEDIDIRMQVKTYVDFLYDKVEKNVNGGEAEEFRKDTKRKFQKIDEKMRWIDGKFIEHEEQTDKFEDKTEKNFRVAESALLAFKTFINQIDSRLTMEEIVARIANKNLEDRFAIDIATIGGQVDLISEDLEARFDAKFQKYQRHIEEDVIQHHTLNLEDQIKQNKQKADNGDMHDKEYYQQKLSEVEAHLIQHEESLQKYNQILSQLQNHDALDSGDSKAVHKQLEELNQKLEQVQKGGVPDSFKENLKNTIMQDVKKELGNQGAGGVNNDEIKKELNKFKELIDKIRAELDENEKASALVDKRIDNLNTSVTGIEKAVKGELEKNFMNQNSNHKDVTNQLTKLFEQFQTLQTKLDKGK